MIKISGLDKLQRELKEAQRAMKAVDGELTQVSFNPEDPESIESAVHQINEAVDQRLGSYAGNPFVAPLIEGMKEQYRQAIMDRAAEARLAGGNSNGE